MIAVGAVLMVGAAAGFVIVPEHKPRPTGWGTYLLDPTGAGWSRSLYDGLRIGTWALLIVGALLVAVGLINYANRARR